jgi:4-alpha-glucanotransferase
MNFLRSSGILLHPTSLPGPFGIGSLGPEAYGFVDILAECRQQFWQVLPLGPTGYGDSPYASFSAFAGNPLLISLDRLAGDGFLSCSDLENAPQFPQDMVDYGPVIEFKRTMLEKSFADFRKKGSGEQQAEFEAFCGEHESWLDSYALFMALKDAHGGVVWNVWDKDIARVQPGALEKWGSKLKSPSCSGSTYSGNSSNSGLS